MVDPSVQLYHDFGVVMIRLGRRWRHITDSEVAKFGLTAATSRPLFHLGKMGEGVRPKDLADALDMEPPSLGQLLDRLEDQGLVQRRDDPEDRRCKTLHLTEAGHAISRQVARIVAQVGESLTEGISEQDLSACLRVFAILEQNVATTLGRKEQGR